MFVCTVKVQMHVSLMHFNFNPGKHYWSQISYNPYF